MRRNLTILGTCLFAFAGTAISTSACKKSAGTNNANPDDTQAIAKTFDDSEPSPAERKPMTGIDVSALDADKKERFEALVDKLASPCGKAHSLRTSKNTDTACIEATFAARFVSMMIRDDLTSAEVEKWYGEVYGTKKPPQAFKLDGALHEGPADAPVKVVEFYDYGCMACKGFAPELDKAVKAYPSDVATYYKQFPLSAHPDSGPAAQAALAAAMQGKFAEMHKLLFANSPRHKLPSLKSYAESIGLDMEKFMADYATAAASVTADKNEGIAAEVQSTPTLFINGKPYGGPHVADYLKLFIEEAIALKR